MNNPKYTRLQLQNYLFTGNIDMPRVQGKPVDMAGFSDRVIDYCVQHNPTAVYALIKQRYPKQFGVNFQRNGEYTQGSQESMKRFLLSQFAKIPAANQAQWLVDLMNATPARPDIKNWTVPIN